MKINKIIIIAGGLLMALFFALVLALPKYQKLQFLNSDIEKKKEELQVQEAYFSQVKEVSAKLQEYSGVLSKIADALPEEPSLASLANFLQVNSAETGLILKKIVLGGTGPVAPSGKKESLSETRFVIQVSGSYQALKDFLAVVENSARMIEVQTLSVETPLEKSGGTPTFTLDLRTFSYQ